MKAQPESWKAFGEEPYDEAVQKSGNFAGRRQRLSPTMRTSKPNPSAFFNEGTSGHKRDCQSIQQRETRSKQDRSAATVNRFDSPSAALER